MKKALLALTLLGTVVATAPIEAQWWRWFAPSTRPTVLYVNSLTGSDANDCTAFAPCATIGRAQTLASAGWTVQVGGGPYAGEVSLTKADVTYRGHTGAGCPTVANDDVNAPATRPAPTVIVGGGLDGFDIQASGITIDCFELRPDSGEEAGATVGAGVRITGNDRTDITVVNNVMSGAHGVCKYGVYAFQSSVSSFVSDLYIAGNYTTLCRQAVFATATNSIFERNESYRLSGGGDTDHYRIFGENITLRMNYMHGNLQSEGNGGIAHIDCVQTYYQGGAWGVLRDSVIENNTCFNAHQGVLIQGTTGGTHDGIVVRNNVFGYGPIDGDDFGWCLLPEGATNFEAYHNTCLGGALGCRAYGGQDSACIFRNNLFYDVSPVPVHLSGSPTLQFDDNLLFRSGTTLSTGTYPSNIWNEDPLLSAPTTGGVALQSGSPAIDAGANVGISVDRYMTVRPKGSGYDIGAHER